MCNIEYLHIYTYMCVYVTLTKIIHKQPVNVVFMFGWS